MEFNSNFGIKSPISIPYIHDFSRNKACYSNLYWGASIKALEYICNKKGLLFVGLNSSACNAFFVRKDLIPNHLRNIKIEDFFIYSKHRESRGKDGYLNFLDINQRIKFLKGKKVFNVITKKITKFESI